MREESVTDYSMVPVDEAPLPETRAERAVRSVLRSPAFGLFARVCFWVGFWRLAGIFCRLAVAVVRFVWTHGGI